MDENRKPKKAPIGLLILSLICIIVPLVIIPLCEYTAFLKDDWRLRNIVHYASIFLYFAGFGMLIAYFVKRFRGRTEGKGSLLFPVLALACDVAGVILLFASVFWSSFAGELPFLIGLLLPVAGILLAVYALSLGKTKNSVLGYILSLFALVIPIICLGLVILYFSFIALVLAGM